jgi:hypothetical protein
LNHPVYAVSKNCKFKSLEKRLFLWPLRKVLWPKSTGFHLKIIANKTSMLSLASLKSQQPFKDLSLASQVTKKEKTNHLENKTKVL